MDINAAVGRKRGLTDDQLATLATFEHSTAFTEQEKAILRYAEGMTQTPTSVPEPVFQELRRFLDEPQIVELTGMIALENFRSRFNRALLIESEGFCELPADHPVRKALGH